MGQHIRKPLNDGYNEIVPPRQPELEYIECGMAKLGPGRGYVEELDGKELVGIVMSGRCNVSGPGFNWEHLGGRKSVFDGKATGFYVPPGNSFTIRGESEATVALCRAPSDIHGEPFVVRPDEVVVNVVGRDNWQREVHSVVDDRFHCDHLVVGETFNAPGNWSSYPPHRHDKDDPPHEVEMEELYHFKVEPACGFGLIRIYTDDERIDEVHVLKDGDTVVIPEGYHPVAAAPAYKLYYLWILAGKNRTLVPRDDPQHAWIKERE